MSEPMEEMDTFEYGDLPEDERMSIREWFEACELGAYIDYDGFAEVFNEENVMLGRYYPSNRHSVPEDASYVIWYNR